MTDREFTFSRSIPLTPGPKLSAESLPVTLPLDQEALLVTDATALVSDVKASMFGFPVVENRQFLLQELPQYGIDENTWLNTPASAVTYLPINSAVNLTIPTSSDVFASHQTKFAYKYQPGKPIFISQAVQIAKGAAIANSFVQWGEYTKNDGYGWRVLSKRGNTVDSITRWHNYLLFFRRTSAIPSGITSTVTKCPSGIVGGLPGVSIGNSTCYRPSYLVGSENNDTTYIGSNTWEDIGFTTLNPDATDTVIEAKFNQDRYTGKEGDAAPGISGTRTKPSAKTISYISDSFEISGGNITNTTITFSNLGRPIGDILSPGMTVRDSNGNRARIVSVNDENSITISATGLSGSPLYFNEESNLCMFLIERSWYGGAGGRGMAYIPDQNPPFNGATRWVPGHEIRVGDTLPVPSMSSPDMPITYMTGKRADKTVKDSSAAFLRRFGVSVWINGGDPRPAKIESASSTGLSVATDSYKIMLAIAVKPFVYNKNVLPVGDRRRPQKSRVYPLSLYVSSTQNTEFYLIKNTTSNDITSGDWYSREQEADHLQTVAVLKGDTATFTSVNNFPSNPGGKLIGAFYCGQNEGAEIDLTEIFDPQRELLGRAETTGADNPGDTLTIIARSLGAEAAIASCALTYGVQ